MSDTDAKERYLRNIVTDKPWAFVDTALFGVLDFAGCTKTKHSILTAFSETYQSEISDTRFFIGTYIRERSPTIIYRKRHCSFCGEKMTAARRQKDTSIRSSKRSADYRAAVNNNIPEK